jgi:hypothetical protein
MIPLQLLCSCLLMILLFFSSYSLALWHWHPYWFSPSFCPTKLPCSSGNYFQYYFLIIVRVGPTKVLIDFPTLQWTTTNSLCNFWKNHITQLTSSFSTINITKIKELGANLLPWWNVKVFINVYNLPTLGFLLAYTIKYPNLGT